VAFLVWICVCHVGRDGSHSADLAQEVDVEGARHGVGAQLHDWACALDTGVVEQCVVTVMLCQHVTGPCT
jgi:hypothetical protein